VGGVHLHRGRDGLDGVEERSRARGLRGGGSLGRGRGLAWRRGRGQTGGRWGFEPHGGDFSRSRGGLRRSVERAEETQINGKAKKNAAVLHRAPVRARRAGG